MQKKKVLFIDRDGTILKEPDGYQIDTFEKMAFVDGVISALKTIVSWNEFELVLVTNQDGLGTEVFPYEAFNGPHRLMLSILKSEGIQFTGEYIDVSFPEEQSSGRKPRTGMLQRYFSEEYDLAGSFVIGDRLTDVELAANLGCKAFFIRSHPELGATETQRSATELGAFIQRTVSDWETVVADLRLGTRVTEIRRRTAETDCTVRIDLDGSGKAAIHTGIAFFDHMLEQIARHGQIDLMIQMKGDLGVDEHHTIEDTAIVLGQVIDEAIGSKRGMERYGFALPMDDCVATCTLDFGGRAELIWKAEFRREFVGRMPTEMIQHFFKSLCAAARCNCYLEAVGENEHHKAESIFKAFAKALLMAKRRNGNWHLLPSTKNVL